MFLLKSQIGAEKSLPATRQNQWQANLATLFDQQRKNRAKTDFCP